MPQEPSQLKAHIREEGEGLRNNLEEFQSRVKNALDWKVWYRKNTALALGGFAVGGFALSLLLAKKPSETRYGFFDQVDSEGNPTYTGPGHAAPKRGSADSASGRIRQAVDTTLSAVASLAAEKVQDLMSEAIPGFRQHYSEARRRRSEQE